MRKNLNKMLQQQARNDTHVDLNIMNSNNFKSVATEIEMKKTVTDAFEEAIQNNISQDEIKVVVNDKNIDI